GVAVDVLQLRFFLGAESFDQRLGQQHYSMAAAHRSPLYDGPFDDVSNVGERNVIALELLRNDRAGCAGRFADAERQVAGWPSHGDSKIPAARGLGVYH